MLSLDDYSEWIFSISTTDDNIHTNNNISKTLLDIGMEAVDHTIHTNSIRASIRVSTGDDGRNLEQQIREIPNITSVQITKGKRQVIRNTRESITFSTSISSIVNRFSQSQVIIVEETSYDNHSQIHIKAEDNSKITINQNIITYKMDESLYSRRLHENMFQDLESLKQETQNSTLKSEDKKNYLTLIEKIKFASSNLPSTISKNRELLKWLVPNAGVAFYSLIELINLLSGN